jgi:hypothetical protein
MKNGVEAGIAGRHVSDCAEKVMSEYRPYQGYFKLSTDKEEVRPLADGFFEPTLFYKFGCGLHSRSGGLSIKDQQEGIGNAGKTTKPSHCS